MSFELRYYQKEAIQGVFKNIVEGNRLLCLVLATGAGKTVVFSNIAKKVLERNKKVLVLAHRTELLLQAKKTLHKIIGECNIQIEQGVESADYDSDIVIASIQTLGRAGSERIKKLNPKDFGLIIIDECFSGDTEILLSDGTTRTIKEIVDNKIPVSVYSENNYKLEENNVYDWFKIKGPRKGKYIKTGNFFNKIKCTDNHKFDVFLDGKKIKTSACDLKIGDNFIRKIQEGNNNEYDFGLDKITEIEDIELDEVYNISVGNSHKYIANGISTYNCHHITANAYQNILSHFGANKQTGLVDGHPVVLGVTATPTRADNIGLDKNLDVIAYAYDMQKAIRDGFLAPIRAFTVFTDTDISGVKSSMGDFNVSELSDTVNNPERNLQVLETYLKKSNGEFAIVFAVDVRHAIDLTQTFINGNVSAKYVTGTFKKELRNSILKEYDRGEFKVLINVSMFSEGFDEPKISSVFLTRPTRSAGLYAQMIGRGTRLFEGKKFCKIFDFVDNTKNNKIVTCASLIGVGQPIKADNTDIYEIKDKIEELLVNKPGTNLRELDLDKIDEKIAEVDIFAAAELDSFVKEYSRYSWTTFVGGFKISLGDNDEGEKTFIEIRENIVGGYDCSIITLRNQSPTFENQYKKFYKEIKAGFSTKDKKIALELGDKIISDNFSDKVNLVSQTAKWKKEPPTEKQIFILRKHGYSNADSLTKGQANQLISKIFADKSNI